MKQQYKDYLFNKHILVSECSTKDPVEVAGALYLLDIGSNIHIKNGLNLANSSVVDYIYYQQNIIPTRVAEPFYKGFPESVAKLSTTDRLFDQLISYMVTYGEGDFDEPVHSVLEEISKREKFNEKYHRIEFDIISVEDAEKRIVDDVNAMLASTRPHSDSDVELICNALNDFPGVDISNCKSKQTAVELLLKTGNTEFAKLLSMFDVVRLVDEINFRNYGNTNIRRLNLKNSDRKFITKVIDTISSNGAFDLPSCFEKQNELCGILHHIHYKPNTSAMRYFVHLIRGGKNYSYMSVFEALMRSGRCDEAAYYLLKSKGQSALLRNVDYIMSRCTGGQKAKVLSMLGSDNVMLLIQLLIHYENYDTESDKPRRFTFYRHKMLTSHTETSEEMKRRKSKIDPFTTSVLGNSVRPMICEALSNLLGRVYIDDSFKNIAVPMNSSCESTGFGTLTTGSRVHIDAGNKKIRAFTYWDHVDDVDLSVIGLGDDGKAKEFSWRTMWDNDESSISYSGDQTAGYKGGSEYFDIEIDALRRQYPHIKYLVFMDNVYTGLPFKKFNCKAGYMLRDIDDSGEVYEPKTVHTSFKIDCDSTMAYLFAIDLEKSDLIWLNVSMNSDLRIGGNADNDMVRKYFNITDVINQYDLFTYMASEVVDSPEDADVIVSDDMTYVDNENHCVIRSYDVEKIVALMQKTTEDGGQTKHGKG